MSIKLNECAVLLRVEIKTWSGQKTDRKVSDEVAKQHNVSKKTGRYVKKLFGDCAELKSVQSSAQTARLKINECTLPHHTDGYRIVPIDKLDTVIGTLNDLKENYQTSVEDFKRVYPQLIERAKVEQNGLFNPADYPNESSLDGRFEFNKHIEPISDSDKFDSMLGLNHVADNYKQEFEDKLAETMLQATSHLVGRIRERLEGTDQTIGIVERLRNYSGSRKGSFRDATITGTVELCDMVDGLNIANDATVKDYTSRLRDACKPGANDIRESETVRMATVNKLSSVLSDITGGEVVDVSNVVQSTNVDSATSDRPQTDDTPISETDIDIDSVDIVASSDKDDSADDADIDFDTALSQLL